MQSFPIWLYVVIAAVFALFLVAALVLRGRRRTPVGLEAPAEKPAEEVRAEERPAEEKPAVVPIAERPRALREGLAKTRGGFIARITDLVAGKKIDDALLGQLEEVLLTADIGVKTSQKLFDAVKQRLSRTELADADAVWSAIVDESRALLALDVPPVDTTRARPFVILVLGVNGVGKTTTIGKLAAKFADDGKKVLLAAGDTFRAAATEQLEIWGQRAQAPVVKGREGSDPSAVIFDAVKRAKAEGFDVVLCDTAGRLHTKANLMDELAKVRRVMQKAEPTAPHETWLVLDSTNGQNAIAQAQMFKQVMDITGIVLTKLDGTAKGGVILGICDELRVPVRFVGIGEKVADLRPFDASEFVDALYERTAT